MATIDNFNDRLHRRVNDALTAGTVHIAGANEIPADEQLPELAVANLKAGRHLLSGMKVYRGSKDPDVDAGTFDASYKHATPSFSTARGYAQTANMNIGLAAKETRGFGVLAEYSLPADAVFTGNFGLEALSQFNSNKNALTVDEAGRLLEPLAQAYMLATGPQARETARDAILLFQKQNMFELAVPAEQAPTRQWVVQHDDVRSRLLAHQDRGPLADVMIDIVTARKSAVDEHTPKQIQSYLGSLAARDRDMLEAVAPGVSSAMQETEATIGHTLTGLRTESDNIRHTSLREAIVWRREAQRGMKLSQLQNSGFSIEHDHPQLKDLPNVQRAAERLELAAFRQAGRQQTVEAIELIEGGVAAALGRQRQLEVVREKTETKASISANLDACVAEQTKAAELLDRARNDHVRNSSGNIFSRLRYRLTTQSQAIEQVGALEAHNAVLKGNVARVSEQWNKSRDDLAAVLEGSEQLNQDIARRENLLQELFKDGSLGFLHPDNRPRSAHLTVDAWKGLARDGRAALAETDSAIARGQDAAQLFRDVTKVGMDRAVASYVEKVEIPEQAKSIVATVAQLGVTVDQRRVEESLRADSRRDSPQLAGSVIHIDQAAKVAVIDVGRREGMPIRLSDLAPGVELTRGSTVHLQSRDGKLHDAVRSAPRAARLTR